MSIRQYSDLVRTVDDYGSLMQRLYKILMIYKRTGAVSIPRFTYLKVEEVYETYIVVGLYRVKETKHYSSVDIVDEMAGPPGLGIGWQPSGEDIIGSEEVYDSSSYAMEQVTRINMPSLDVDLLDDSELDAMEHRYEREKAKRDNKARRESLVKEISKTQEKLDKLEVAEKELD